MKLTLENLKQAGAFTGAPVEKEISWKQGGEEFTATVYVRRLSYQAAVMDLDVMRGRVDAAAARIATSICDECGNAVFTPQDITGEADAERGQLDGNLTMALLAVIAEVNNAGKTKG